MSMFGQVIPFRARREPAPAPPKPVHRSLSAALAEAGLADGVAVEPPPLGALTVEPEAGVVADELSPKPEDDLAPAEEFPPASDLPTVVAKFPPVVTPEAPPQYVPQPAVVAAPVAVEAPMPLPRVIALATRHPPNVAAYPWVKSARRRRFKTRVSEAVSWLVTIAIVAGMVGVAATYLTPLRSMLEPVAQR